MRYQYRTCIRESLDCAPYEMNTWRIPVGQGRTRLAAGVECAAGRYQRYDRVHEAGWRPPGGTVQLCMGTSMARSVASRSQQPAWETAHMLIRLEQTVPLPYTAHMQYRNRAHLLPLDELAAGGDAVRVAKVVVRHLALQLYGTRMGGGSWQQASTLKGRLGTKTSQMSCGRAGRYRHA